MILSLSGRMFTVEGKSSEFELTPEEFVRLAAEIGYGGVEIRRGVIDDSSTQEDARKMKEILDKHGIRCAFITANPAMDEESLKKLCHVIDLAAILGSEFVRHDPRDEKQLPLIQKACDYAVERGVKIVGQIHNGTLFEHVDPALATLQKVDRDNFGVAFEPCHLLMGNEPGNEEEWVRKLSPHIFTVSLQNYKNIPRPAPGQKAFQRDGRYFIPIAVDETGGVNFQMEFQALKQAGFDGFVTYMAGRIPGRDSKEVAREAFAFLSKLIEN